MKHRIFLTIGLLTLLAGCAARHRVDGQGWGGYDVRVAGVTAEGNVPPDLGNQLQQLLDGAIAVTAPPAYSHPAGLTVTLSRYRVARRDGGYRASVEVAVDLDDMESGQPIRNDLFPQAATGSNAPDAAAALAEAIAQRLEGEFALSQARFDANRGYYPQSAGPYGDDMRYPRPAPPYYAPRDEGNGMPPPPPSGDIFLNSRTTFGRDGTIAPPPGPGMMPDAPQFPQQGQPQGQQQVGPPVVKPPFEGQPVGKPRRGEQPLPPPPGIPAAGGMPAGGARPPAPSASPVPPPPGPQGEAPKLEQPKPAPAPGPAAQPCVVTLENDCSGAPPKQK